MKDGDARPQTTRFPANDERGLTGKKICTIFPIQLTFAVTGKLEVHDVSNYIFEFFFVKLEWKRFIVVAFLLKSRKVLTFFPLQHFTLVVRFVNLLMKMSS